MTVRIDPKNVAVAGAIGGMAAACIGELINGRLFREFRAHTPHTWRKETARHYVLGSATLFLTGFTYAIFFAPLGSLVLYNLTHWAIVGAMFGLGCWGALAMPLILTIAVFANFHRGVVIGMLIEWLLISMVCGMICARIIPF